MATPQESEPRPLSAAQSGIWVAQMLDTRSPAYNVGEYLEILGPIDPGLFEAALRRIVSELDALRLRFVDTGDGPRQWIGPEPEWVMPFVDVGAVDDPRAAAEAWMRDDMARLVDLGRGPLFGFALFRAGTFPVPGTFSVPGAWPGRGGPGVTGSRFRRPAGGGLPRAVIETIAPACGRFLAGG